MRLEITRIEGRRNDLRLRLKSRRLARRSSTPAQTTE